MEKVAPNIVRLCDMGPERTILTRFIPARRPGQGQGAWRRYYNPVGLDDAGGDRRGHDPTIPELAAFVLPAQVVDRPVYSPWLGCARDGARRCRPRLSDDPGWDAVCSASDEAHDVMLELFGTRYDQHGEIATVSELAPLWSSMMRNSAGFSTPAD